MSETRCRWSSPELVVLARSRPEEAVLGACKGGQGILSNNSLFNGCQYASAGCNQLCNAIVAS